jgi:hypothetical protein
MTAHAINKQCDAIKKAVGGAMDNLSNDHRYSNGKVALTISIQEDWDTDDNGKRTFYRGLDVYATARATVTVITTEVVKIDS